MQPQTPKSEDTVEVDAGNHILSAVKCTLSSSESEGPLTLAIEECTAALLRSDETEQVSWS